MERPKDRRRALAAGTEVMLKTSEGTGARVMINKEIGRGGSFLCYDVQDDNGVRGTLKEFYPLTVNGELMHLTRGRDGGILPGDEAFGALLSEGIARIERSHENLRQMQCTNEAARNYFNYSRLCYGGGTVYIYFPADKVGETYSKYLRTLKAKFPSRGENSAPELRLINILRVCLDLARTVDMLCSAGYFSFDITPDNFMVITSISGDPINDVVYLFDTDTLTYQDDIIQRRIYVPVYRSQGFNSPIVTGSSLRERPELCYEADAYSVMAVLYYSLTEKYLAGDPGELLRQLEGCSLLKSCKRLRSSEVWEPFMNKLTELFSATAFQHLCPGGDSFSSADVAEGLEVLSELAGSVRHEFSFAGSGIAPQKKDYDLETMLANTLYRYPLYINAGEEDLRVLILGFGDCGKSAFRLVFSAGQNMISRNGCLESRGLHIAVAEKLGDIKKYLSSMPALKRFARVTEGKWLADGKLPEETYADISLCRENADAENVAALLERYPANYILCCLGNDIDNVRLARAVFELTRETKPFIGCVNLGGSGVPKGTKAIRPIADYSDIDPDLLNMAFNEHYLYDRCSRDRVSRSLIHKGFKDSYVYQSNISSAMHIKYKLNSLGIKLDDPVIAAERFKELVLDAGDRETVEGLTYVEHRRWVANNIVQGYDAPQDYNYIREINDYRDKEHLLHPTMVRSGREMVIWDSFDWDKDDLDELDELDRVSVELYRYYRDNRTYHDTESQEHCAVIKRLISEDRGAAEAFQTLGEMITLIFQDVKYGADNFDFEADRFRQYLKKRRKQFAPVREENELTARIDLLKKSLFLRIEYLRKKENKGLDRMFVENIPFILKFREFALFQSLCTVSGGSVWAVRNALDLDAGKIYWVELIDCDETAAAAPVRGQLANCVDVYRRVLSLHEHRSFIDHGKLCLLVEGCDDTDEKEVLWDELTELCSASGVPLSDIELISVGSKGLRAAAEKLYKRSGSCTPINGFTRDSVFYGIFEELGAKPLSRYSDCLMDYSFSVREYMSLQGAGLISDSYSRTTIDHRLLWAMFSTDMIYTDGGVDMKNASPESLWMWTCKLLDVSRSVDVMGEIPDRPIDQGESMFYSRKNIELLDSVTPRIMLGYLVQKGLISDLRLESMAEGFGWETGRGSFNSDLNRHKYELSFRYPEGTDCANVIQKTINKYCSAKEPLGIMVDYDYVKRAFVIKTKTRSFRLLDSNTAQNDDARERVAAYYRAHRAAMDTLIGKLKEYGFIKRGEGGVYYFNDPEQEEILTKEGSLLELFIYRSLIGTDDVSNAVMNLFFRWDRSREDSTTNELDVVAVKGKKALFISAKACLEIDKDMVTEIAAIADRFGAVPVLISGNSDARDSKIVRRARDMGGLVYIQRRQFSSDDPLEGELRERLEASARRDEKLLARKLMSLFDDDQRIS